MEPSITLKDSFTSIILLYFQIKRFLTNLFYIWYSQHSNHHFVEKKMEAENGSITMNQFTASERYSYNQASGSLLQVGRYNNSIQITKFQLA